MLFLVALALVAGISVSRAGEFTIAGLDDIGGLPCAIFAKGNSLGSFIEGAGIKVDISSTNNGALFARLADRLAQCRQDNSLPVVSALAPPVVVVKQ